MSEFVYITSFKYINEFEGFYREVLRQAREYHSFLGKMGFGSEGVFVDIESIDGDCYGDGIEGYVEKWRVEFRSSGVSGVTTEVREYSKVSTTILLDAKTGETVFEVYDHGEFEERYLSLIGELGYSVEEARDLYWMDYGYVDPYVEIKERVDRENG